VTVARPQPASTPMLTPTLCILPWMHLSTTVDGVWGRCCFDATIDYSHYYEHAEEPEFRLADDAIGCVKNSRYAEANHDRVFGLKDAFNSPQLRRTRLQMLAGERPAACGFCYSCEDDGGDSHRLAMNREMIRYLDGPELIGRTADDGGIDAVPIFLDLRFGNTCNLECIMCSFPTTSKLGAGAAPRWTTANIDPYRDEDLWAEFREIAPDLRFIYFAGGEPFLQPQHARMLRLIIDQQVAPQVSLRYNSNLTVLPDGIFDLLGQFRQVIIAASCDGTGEAFERIRLGAGWEKFVSNLREARRHVSVVLDASPQRENVANLPELIGFAAAEGVPIRLENFVHFPHEFSLRNLPPADKERHARTLSAAAERCQQQGNEEISGQLGRLIDFMNLAPDPGFAPAVDGQAGRG